ncbi:MAG TPA: T9SS type A sorting domain-containing protein [Puia sp.]|jgi:hypothetical protein|nr:T9SS type A sorting domain-containing protein [Puia sp.]
MNLFVHALRKTISYSFASSRTFRTLTIAIISLSASLCAEAQFQLGENPGYYGSQYTDQQIYDLMYAAGARSARSTVSVQYYLQWGMSTYQARLQYPSSKGMKNNTFFLDASAGPTYTGQSSATASNGARSWLPDGLYNAAFNSDGSINTSNIWAKYCYDVVQSVGANFTYFEVWNEPDLTGSPNSYEDSTQSSSSWEKVEPASGDLQNMNASVEDYVQLCMIANQVIKKYQPAAKIATGGLGYPWFYMWFLKKGGAQWIDELSIHFYPYFSWTVCSWTGSACGLAGFHRNSDYAVSAMTQQVANFRAIETATGNPHKPIMMTESNIPRWSYVSAANLETFPNNKAWGSDATQKNYTIKAFAKMMEAGLDMFYLYQTGETGDSGLNNGTAGSEIDAMGMYKNLVKATPGNEALTSQGIAIRTMQQLMGNYKVDATQPTFPSGVDGVRFDSAGNKIYVVWAITTQDMSETASGSYTLPSGVNFKQYLYDGTSPGQISGTVSLIGDPYILVQTNGTINSLSCNAGTNQTITLPTSTITLDASGSSSGNDSISSYNWTQISGPNNSTILNDSALATTANNLVAGNYNYELKIKDASGDSCISTVQVSVQSLLSPISNLLPPVPVLASNQTITLPINSIWLIGSGSYEPGGSIASYSWKQISGPTSIIFNTNIPTTLVAGLVAGTYVFQLTITDNSGATAIATTTVTVNSLNILQDAATQTTDSSTTEKDISAPSTATSKMQLYPNPAQGTINLQLNSDTTGTIVIRIFSITGHPVITKQSEKSGNYYQSSFDISGLASGTYMMQILIGGKQQLTAKFLKQ